MSQNVPTPGTPSGPPRDPLGRGEIPTPLPKFLPPRDRSGFPPHPPPAPGAELSSEPPDLGRKKWKWEFLCHRHRHRHPRDTSGSRDPPPSRPDFGDKNSFFSRFSSFSRGSPRGRGSGEGGAWKALELWRIPGSQLRGGIGNSGFPPPPPIPTSGAAAAPPGPFPRIPAFPIPIPTRSLRRSLPLWVLKKKKKKFPFKPFYWEFFPPLPAPRGEPGFTREPHPKSQPHSSGGTPPNPTRLREEEFFQLFPSFPDFFRLFPAFSSFR